MTKTFYGVQFYDFVHAPKTTWFSKRIDAQKYYEELQAMNKKARCKIKITSQTRKD